MQKFRVSFLSLLARQPFVETKIVSFAYRELIFIDILGKKQSAISSAEWKNNRLDFALI